MSQLECKGIILVDSKLENILLQRERESGLISFPKKINYFEKITREFTNEYGIDIDRITVGKAENNVRYFLGIVNDAIFTIKELRIFFHDINAQLEWTDLKRRQNLNDEMNNVIDNAIVIFKNIPNEERSSARDWKENLLQFQDL